MRRGFAARFFIIFSIGLRKPRRDRNGLSGVGPLCAFAPIKITTRLRSKNIFLYN